MHKIALAALGLLATPTLSIAQAKSGMTVNYSIVNTEPVFKHTALLIDPVLFGVGGINGGLASALKVETQIGKVMPWAKIRNAWTESGSYTGDFTDAPVSIDGMKKQMSTEIGCVYFLLDNTKDADVKVTTHVQRAMRTEIHYYVRVPSKVRRMLGVGAGHITFRSPLNVDQDSWDNFYYKSKDGSYQVPFTRQYDPNIYPAMDPNLRQPSGTHELARSMSNTGSFFVGAHYRKVTNTIIMIDGARRRSNARISDIYADVVLPYSNKITNVMDTKGIEWQLAAQDKAINTLGWRAGFSIRQPKGHFWQVGAEVGKIPGTQVPTLVGSSGLYFALNMGGSIGFGKYAVAKKTAGKKERRDD